MRPIQFVLILGLLASLGLYWYAFRTALRNRLLALGLLLAGLVAILFPDYTTVIAEWLGVARGTDLVMYLFFVTALFIGVLLFSKISRVERCQTELVRALAILNVTRPSGSRGDDDLCDPPTRRERETIRRTSRTSYPGAASGGAQTPGVL
jgi:hypothetical protein